MSQDTQKQTRRRRLSHLGRVYFGRREGDVLQHTCWHLLVQRPIRPSHHYLRGMS